MDEKRIKKAKPYLECNIGVWFWLLLLYLFCVVEAL